jgi:hypothetical protein
MIGIPVVASFNVCPVFLLLRRRYTYNRPALYSLYVF